MELAIKSIYLIGSLRNPKIPKLQKELIKQGFDCFAAWFSAGKIADRSWMEHEKYLGHSYKESLKGYAASHVFEFDKKHLDRCDASILLMPAGKSGHIELGYTIGRGKPGFVLFDRSLAKYDVMYKFATDVFFDKKELFKELNEYSRSF